jgi:dTDP-4-dehydrorhamnose 3,5-epimerase
MKFTATRLPDVVVIEPVVFSDERGWFMESFNHKRFADGLAALGLPQPRPFVQDNESQSAKGVLRGLQWVAEELSAANRKQLWIPEGFAHGFVALQDDTRFVYKTTDLYAQACERALRWDDPAIGITWPAGLLPRLAPKDAAAPWLADADVF